MGSPVRLFIVQMPNAGGCHKPFIHVSEAAPAKGCSNYQVFDLEIQISLTGKSVVRGCAEF